MLSVLKTYTRLKLQSPSRLLQQRLVEYCDIGSLFDISAKSKSANAKTQK